MVLRLSSASLIFEVVRERIQLEKFNESQMRASDRDGASSASKYGVDIQLLCSAVLIGRHGAAETAPTHVPSLAHRTAKSEQR